MKPSYLRICRLLAFSGFREREIADFAYTLFQVGPDALMEEVKAISHLSSDFPRSNQDDLPSTNFSLPPSEVEEKIERLLIDDARMPKAIAVEQLSAELRRRFPDLNIPSESRKGFRLWIRRLTGHLSEKELLHIATNLRSRYVHDSPPDWRLK